MKISKRTAERMIREAYSLDDLAARLRANGFIRYADTVKGVAELMHKSGRDLMDDLEKLRLS